MEALQNLLGGENHVVQEAGTLWNDWRDVAGFAMDGEDIWRVSCKPSDGPDLALKSGALAVRYDWAGGLIWLRTPAGYDLRAALGRYDGHATLVRGKDQQRFEPEAAGVARLTAGLRMRFDPRNLLNRGLMG